MLTKWLVPELAYLNVHPLHTKLYIEAQRSFGFTFIRGLILGVAMLIPSICILITLRDYGVVRRFGPSTLLYVFILLCAFLKWMVMLANRHPTRVKIRELMRGYGIRICRGCGYNLTGNVSGVCPECGKSTAELDDLAS
ncbi:MAG: hypothetical protein DHS20C16_09380 [Phycisphaerae bacterium]|nr:MAG: hypothetical protein DHS20C16_09380 [Phycisphaerae bacterium]